MTKYNFERDFEGRCINPNTHLPFKWNDVYNGKYFSNYRKRKNGIKFPTFSSTKNSEAKRKSQRSGLQRTFSSLIGRLFSAARARAKENNAVCTITRLWIQKNIERGYVMNGVKIMDFTIAVNGHMHPFTPSIDRIDSKNRNYTEENCQIIPSLLNLAKNRWSDEDFLQVVKPYIVYLENQLHVS